MKENIRIASGQGFWGDLMDAPFEQVSHGDIDYLVMDYLAEVTMSIMQKQKNRNPEHGYALDLPGVVERILPICREKGIKVITNGGGVNPQGCAKAILEAAQKQGIEDLKVAVVLGDDILGRLDELLEQGAGLDNMESGELVAKVKDRFMNANVYFGAWPIVEALQQGAEIVITGRTTDTGLTLAPMIYEFGWSRDNYDLMAAGTIAGHVLECGAQASGGNFSAGWEEVEDFVNIGFPIAEAYPDGTFVITKHEDLGGLVDKRTVSEQLVYEIGDPAAYITPDCIADFTSIQLKDDGRNRVLLHGIKGKPETEFYKVSCSYADGFSAVSTLVYSWPDALKKAKAADRILRGRLKKLGLEFDEIRTEYVGYDACHGPLGQELPEDAINEIQLRVGVRGKDRAAIERFGKEIAPLILTGPPSVTGFAGGRVKPREVIAYWPALIPKKLVTPLVKLYEGSYED